METPTWINAIASLITALSALVTASSIVLIWLQVKLLSKQIKADHERSRRDNAIKLSLEWATRIKQTSALSRKFVETLDDKQARSLVDQKPFKVTAEHKNMILGCLAGISGELDLKEENGFIHLTEKEAAYLRWQVISDLNLLETIFTAWRHGIADQDIIKEEFHYLISPEKGYYILEKFRQAGGGKKVYPAIARFVEVIKTEQEKEGSPDKPVIA